MQLMQCLHPACHILSPSIASASPARVLQSVLYPSIISVPSAVPLAVMRQAVLLSSVYRHPGPPLFAQHAWIPQSPSPQVATGTCTFCSSIFSSFGGFGRSSCKGNSISNHSQLPCPSPSKPPCSLVPLSP